ncbi:sensor histidine kinase [Cohnella cellulosilytica]|uniref:histidine kinase n=1 Tax=Cohnella cellulosilytica TaxID=986710 RepID=A0ABW2FPI5_9BACL
MRLKNKIHLYSSLLFAVLLILMNALIYLLFDRMSLGSEMKQAETEAAAIAEGIRRNAAGFPVRDLLRAYVPADGMLRIVAQEDGIDYPPVTSSSQSKLSKLDTRFYPEKIKQAIPYAGEKYALVSLPVIWNDGSVVNVQVVRSLRETTDNLQSLRIVLIAVTVLALVPVVASGRWLGKLIVQPIANMTKTMKEIRESGRFKRLEFDDSAKDELSEMGRTFNRMIELLESNFEKQERFASNASHELKTPLTVIESYANLLKRKGLERPDLFAESVEAIHSEAVRMREMTEQLLLLARSRSGWNANPEALDLEQLAIGEADAFRKAYRRDVHVEAESPAVVLCDRSLLRQLLFLFLDNARKYSEEPIAITVGADGESAWIRIADRGVGIPKHELPKVFDRFYRVDQARTRRNGGFGLGLSLAKEIAEAIGASVELDSLEGVGTTATIRLPASR